MNRIASRRVIVITGIPSKHRGWVAAAAIGAGALMRAAGWFGRHHSAAQPDPALPT